jgi:thymidine phosphorylase
VDPSVGFDRLKPRGAQVGAGEPLARVHAADESHAAAAAAALIGAYTLGEGRPQAPLLVERIA